MKGAGSKSRQISTQLGKSPRSCKTKNYSPFVSFRFLLVNGKSALSLQTGEGGASGRGLCGALGVFEVEVHK